MTSSKAGINSCSPQYMITPHDTVVPITFGGLGIRIVKPRNIKERQDKIGILEGQLPVSSGALWMFSKDRRNGQREKAVRISKGPCYAILVGLQNDRGVIPHRLQSWGVQWQLFTANERKTYQMVEIAQKLDFDKTSPMCLVIVLDFPSRMNAERRAMFSTK